MENLREYINHIYNLTFAHNPLKEWGRINYDLDKLYKQYGIENDKYGRNIKNTARHFTGGALGNKYYGFEIVNELGQQKENTDAIRDAGKDWLDDDTFIDKANNIRGIVYSSKNPKATRKDIYNAAIMQAINNYKNDYPQN